MLTGQLVKKFLLKCKCTVYYRVDGEYTFEFLMCQKHRDLQDNYPWRFVFEATKLMNEAIDEVN